MQSIILDFSSPACIKIEIKLISSCCQSCIESAKLQKIAKSYCKPLPPVWVLVLSGGTLGKILHPYHWTFATPAVRTRDLITGEANKKTTSPLQKKDTSDDRGRRVAQQARILKSSRKAISVAFLENCQHFRINHVNCVLSLDNDLYVFYI